MIIYDQSHSYISHEPELHHVCLCALIHTHIQYRYSSYISPIALFNSFFGATHIFYLHLQVCILKQT